MGISLPGYAMQWDRETLKTLKVTDQQQKQLKEVQRQFRKESRDFAQSQKGVSEKEVMKASAAWGRQPKDKVTKGSREDS